jgi:hypothetical protein
MGLKSSTVSSLTGLSSLVLYLRVRLGAYPKVEYLKGASLVLAEALLAPIRQGPNVIKHFKVVTYERL